jgi:L-rhamnose isomerase
MQHAKEVYSKLGVDVEHALEMLGKVSLSLPAWQIDDVAGFERAGDGGTALDSGGCVVTGGHPGRARTLAEMRTDLAKALSLIPGTHRINLHALHGDFCPSGAAAACVVDRDAIAPEHFASWIEWARGVGVALDFNPTLFSHPRAASGFTLSSKDPAVRAFWIEHCRRARTVATAIGRA